MKAPSDRPKDPSSYISIPLCPDLALIISAPKCLQYYTALKGILYGLI